MIQKQDGSLPRGDHVDGRKWEDSSVSSRQGFLRRGLKLKRLKSGGQARKQQAGLALSRQGGGDSGPKCERDSADGCL